MKSDYLTRYLYIYIYTYIYIHNSSIIERCWRERRPLVRLTFPVWLFREMNVIPLTHSLISSLGFSLMEKKSVKVWHKTIPFFWGGRMIWTNSIAYIPSLSHDLSSVKNEADMCSHLQKGKHNIVIDCSTWIKVDIIWMILSIRALCCCHLLRRDFSSVHVRAWLLTHIVPEKNNQFQTIAKST